MFNSPFSAYNFVSLFNISIISFYSCLAAVTSKYLFNWDCSQCASIELGLSLLLPYFRFT